MKMGTLFLVATPIGNLEDITLRALNVLRQAVLIAAEDTRQTRKLLQRYEVSTPMLSYHEHNKLRRVKEILEALASGDVALVSDAGTPGLNDPGYELVQAALAASFPVSPVPGPTAPIAALVISGLPTDAFLYLGYLPRKRTERRTRLADVASLPYTLIFLETPHRLRDALDDLETEFGNRPVAVAREMTKAYEETFRGSLAQAREYFGQVEPRGEFTLVVGGASSPSSESWSPEQLQKALQDGIDDGLSASQLSAELAAESGWPRRTIYQMVLDQKNRMTPGEDAHEP
jgi:16S rRNA (cytidine1402-2'-O)-methyltransferase